MAFEYAELMLCALIGWSGCRLKIVALLPATGAHQHRSSVARRFDSWAASYLIPSSGCTG